MSHELYRSHEPAHEFDSMVVQDINQRDQLQEFLE